MVLGYHFGVGQIFMFGESRPVICIGSRSCKTSCVVSRQTVQESGPLIVPAAVQQESVIYAVATKFNFMERQKSFQQYWRQRSNVLINWSSFQNCYDGSKVCRPFRARITLREAFDTIQVFWYQLRGWCLNKYLQIFTLIKYNYCPKPWNLIAFTINVLIKNAKILLLFNW